MYIDNELINDKPKRIIDMSQWRKSKGSGHQKLESIFSQTKWKGLKKDFVFYYDFIQQNVYNN